jgi:hypothetical protein
MTKDHRHLRETSKKKEAKFERGDKKGTWKSQTL